MAGHKKVKNIGRKSLQWTTLILLAYMVIRLWINPNYIADFEAYCPFGGLQAFASFSVNNSLACSMAETQIFMGILLAIGIILFSKLFCSYICPVGTFTEWLGRIGDRFHVRYQIKGVADRLFRILKYALLFVTVYFTVTSSELFCKEYDPYYAIFTGFGSDVVFWMALTALAITILGAIFIRQFWCKYLCPLGALSNIFTNVIMFAAVMVAYLLLLYFGLKISWVWPLAIITVFGYLLEATRLKGWLFPVFKITRKEQSCINCNICDLACPMGLEIAHVDVIDHIDCHLCGDCIQACPVNNTLQINKKEWRWLPSVATVSLIAIGLFLATTIELPTINMRWGNDRQLATASIFSQSGIKSVKCYGSSVSFANKMKRVPGVLGVETFVKSHKVKVLYDPKKLDEEQIRKSIFTPGKTLLHRPPADIKEIAVVKMGVDKLFDSYDAFYFTQLLRQQKGVFGFSTRFGEPVKATIFFDSSAIQPSGLKQIIEQPTVTYRSRGKTYTKPIRFKVTDATDSLRFIKPQSFISSMFQPYNKIFNKYKTYRAQDLQIYQIAMPQALNPRFRRSMSLLVSHLSTDDFIVRFQTIYKERPYARIYFVRGKTDVEHIYRALTLPKLTVHYRGGKTGEVKNPFQFSEKGLVLKIGSKKTLSSK